MTASNDTFNYLAVLFSIIVGLAATELLQSIRALLVARARVVPYAPAIVRVATLLLILAQTWWSTFGLRAHLDWTFGMYAMVLLQMMLIYLVAALALPSPAEDTTVDLRTAYFAHARLVYGLLVAAAVVSVAKDVVVDGRLPPPVNLGFLGFLAAISTAQAISRNDLLHRVATAVSLVAFAAFVVLLFDRLPG